MNIRTNLDLKLTCARLLGADDLAQLGDEASDVQAYVNQAYRMCYNPASGIFPRWARRPIGVHFEGPKTVTFTATKGSRELEDFIGADLGENYLGARVKVGDDRFYTYDGKNDDDLHCLVEPWAEPSGTYTAVVHTCVAPLGLNVVHVFGKPEVVGGGLLYALAGYEGEIDLRATWPTSDFYTIAGAASGGISRPINWTTWATGTPCFYYVRETTQPYGLAVYPLPERALSVRLTVGFLPEPLTSDEQVPVLPGQAIEDILAPIARFLTATQSKRFAGENIQGLKQAYDTALARLTALAAPQLETGGVIRPARRFP